MHARAQGFTLPELLVTIAIMATLLGVAAPSYREYRLEQRIAARASELHADLSVARMEALRRAAPAELRAIDGDWSKGWDVVVQELRDATARVVPLNVRATRDGERISVEQGGLAAAVVRFDARGHLETPAEIVVTACLVGERDVDAREVHVSPSGFAAVRRASGHACEAG